MAHRLLPIVLLLYVSSALTGEKFTQVRIQVPDRSTLDLIWSTGIDHEGATGKIGSAMEFVAGDFELDQLRSLGISFQIVVDDLATFYEGRLAREAVNALGFGDGSMGGFYTFEEVVSQLDTMKVLFPDIISARDSIGHSVEGRPIWAVKISDNPHSHEADEPEVLYTSLHHAREPQGMMTVIYYMWWLLENYGTDPDATYLVNNRQMWFIPVVNPDGYEYNRRTNPNGGGMWRKNRRNNNGSYGVDPNRNYGPVHMWNSPNGGSSTIPASETYRGPTPFSEPENQAIDRFMRAHNIRTCLNYHTFGNYLIYPWGYLSHETGDSLIYRDWAYDMTAENRYKNGTDRQTVYYSTRGNSDDFMFGDTTKPITYAMTPEVGLTGFWPSTSEILSLAIANLSMNKRLAYVAGPFPILQSYDIHDDGGNGFIDRGEGFDLVVRIRNKGLRTTDNLIVSVASSSPSVEFARPTTELPSIGSQGVTHLLFSGQASPNSSTGVPLQLFVTFTDLNGFYRRDTIDMFLGTPDVLLADSANNGTAQWTTDIGWGVTANAHTPPFAFADSPTGRYLANTNNALTLTDSIDLSGYDYAQLRFWSKWDIEPTWDFATVEVSTDNGTSWTTLRTKLTQRGSGRTTSRQPAGTWGFDGHTPGLDWVEQDIDLSRYVNKNIKIRFRMSADGSDERDGFWVDDIRIYAFTTETITDTYDEPAAPLAYALYQNYPNPFNPETSISFDLPKPAFITLSLYNLLGQEVAHIVNEYLSAGTQTFKVDAGGLGLSSGIYFYRLTAEGFTKTMKMLLIR